MGPHQLREGWGTHSEQPQLSVLITLPSLFQVRTNVPSWCDRILWKSYPETHIICNSYGQSLLDRVMGDPGWSVS